jgi:hypothetical protein
VKGKRDERDDHEVARVDAVACRKREDDRPVPWLPEDQAHRRAEEDHDAARSEEPTRVGR